MSITAALVAAGRFLSFAMRVLPESTNPIES
jgi:hypothetical protein